MSVSFGFMISEETDIRFHNYTESGKEWLNSKATDNAESYITPKFGENLMQEKNIIATRKDENIFNKLYSSAGESVFFDDCTQDWTKNWSLDGKVGYVENSDEGMALYAGSEIKDNTHHVVLWTKQSFSGDLLIEYDYTRIDKRDRQVNIIYIQATGCEVGEYSKDIFQWNELREEPAMNCYYDNMNVLHISYAALSAEGDYIRARRYRPDFNDKMNGTDLGSQYNTGFFNTGIKHHITIIKKGYDLYMKVSNDEKTMLYKWNYKDHPAIIEGPVGLRQMFSRSALYKNFTVKQITSNHKTKR